MQEWSSLDPSVLDHYRNLPCEWCGKQCIVKRLRIEGEDLDHIILLCDFCSLFETKEEMLAAKSEIITNAINPELSDDYGYPWI